MTVSESLKKGSNQEVEKKTDKKILESMFGKENCFQGRITLKGGDQVTLSDFVELCSNQILDNSRAVRYIILF